MLYYYQIIIYHNIIYHNIIMIIEIELIFSIANRKYMLPSQPIILIDNIRNGIKY